MKKNNQTRQLADKKINHYRPIELLGVRVDLLSLAKITNRVEKWVNSNKQYQITTTNPEHIVMCQRDYRFKKIINNSALSVADGIGIIWAVKTLALRSFVQKFFSSVARLKRKLRRYPSSFKQTLTIKKENFRQTPRASKYQRISGVDLMLELCKLANRKKWRIFLLGGQNRVAELAALKLKIKNTKLKIESDNGAVDAQNETPAEGRQTIKRINDFKPHLLFVAYGAPMQEKWIDVNLKKLNVKVAIGVGGAFDFISGKVKRAPKVIQKLNLEWFWRLLLQPWRWKRQLRLVKFIWLVLKEKFQITKSKVFQMNSKF